MPNMKSLSLMVQKLWRMLKFFCHRQIHVDRQAKNYMPPNRRFRGHKKESIQPNVIIILNRAGWKLSTCPLALATSFLVCGLMKFER